MYIFHFYVSLNNSWYYTVLFLWHQLLRCNLFEVTFIIWSRAKLLKFNFKSQNFNFIDLLVIIHNSWVISQTNATPINIKHSNNQMILHVMATIYKNKIFPLTSHNLTECRTRTIVFALLPAFYFYCYVIYSPILERHNFKFLRKKFTYFVKILRN